MTEPTISELQAQIAIYDEKFRASEARVFEMMKELDNERGGWDAACARSQEIKDMRRRCDEKVHFYKGNVDDLCALVEELEPAWVLGFSNPIPNDPIRNLRLS